MIFRPGVSVCIYRYILHTTKSIRPIRPGPGGPIVHTLLPEATSVTRGESIGQHIYIEEHNSDRAILDTFQSYHYNAMFTLKIIGSFFRQM